MKPEPETPASSCSAFCASADDAPGAADPGATLPRTWDRAFAGGSRSSADGPLDAGDADSEAAFVARLRSGDSAAFEQMVRTYGPRLLKLARRYLPKESDAEDTVQDAFLSAFRAIGAFAGDSRIGTWLHRITVNAALMRIRSRARRPENFIDDVQQDFGGDPQANVLFEPSATELLDSAETREVVRVAVGRLEENSRIVVRLRDIERIELREISLLLGVGLSTVKSRLRRGRLALRAALASHFRAIRP